MSVVEGLGPARWVVGLLSREPALLDRAAEALQGHIGVIEASSPTWPFDFTDYYRSEMGPDLLRRFLLFAPPAVRTEMAALKRWAGTLEAELARERGCAPLRIVNIDPGYLDRDRVVLASTKDRYHRLPLGKGIFGEVTLAFIKGEFRPFSWTYPDFHTTEIRRCFQNWRSDWVS